jgi:ribosome-binding factor A
VAREFKRSDRLGEQIQRELAELLQFHSRVHLPGLVTVSGVKLSRDMGYADVHISVLGGGDDAPTRALDAINSQKGYLRTELSQRLHVRRVPELRFYGDSTQQDAARMATLISKARASDSDISEE